MTFMPYSKQKKCLRTRFLLSKNSKSFYWQKHKPYTRAMRYMAPYA